MVEFEPAHRLERLRAQKISDDREAIAPSEAELQAAELEARAGLARLAAKRRAASGGPVAGTHYRFTDEGGRDVGLIDLFGGHRTLVTYLWKFGPHRAQPCPTCTDLLDPLEANAEGLEERIALVVFGRSCVRRQRAFATERGWSRLRFCQPRGDDYAKDLGGLDERGNEFPRVVVYQRDERDDVRVLYCAQTPGEPGRLDDVLVDNILEMTGVGAPQWDPTPSD